MPYTATSQVDSELVSAFTDNEFDIAGLAEFTPETQTLDDCLRKLHSIIRRRCEPHSCDKQLLAQVLFGMTAVAREDYAADGHQEYWPFLFGRIRDAVQGDPTRVWSDTLADQQSQSLLGRWFRRALRDFGYSIPDQGQTYVGPIVFHAGIPRTSLPRVLEVIASACEHYGPQAVNLPADIRSALVVNHFLHRNVERLLSSNLQGAAQLWGCLSRVVLAWQTLGDCSEELRQLPLSLDPDDVRAALPTKSVSQRTARLALPQLRYDVETGEIRLAFPKESATDWTITCQAKNIEVMWARTHLGRTAEFRQPLPEEITATPRETASAIGRTFCPRPSDWPGFWFHAHNGNLEDGQSIDASGLEAGRWYVVFEGTPTHCSVPYAAQIQLKWSWFAGNGDWTAWEIEVPPRTADCTHLEWHVGDNVFSVPLARRSGAKLEFDTTPLATATTAYGNEVSIFDSAPRITLKRERALQVLLLSETNDSVAVVERLELPPEKSMRLPVSQPGVYQVREARGVGRTLLQFAIVPELRIIGPAQNAAGTSASVRISADQGVGEIECDQTSNLSKDGPAWFVEASTVEPFLTVNWSWNDSNIPALQLRWPIEALRWRVTQIDNIAAEWTRDPVFVDPKSVSQYDAQLEIQCPDSAQLAINGEPYCGKVQRGVSGNALMLSLMSFGDAVELTYDGREYAAVFLSEQPLIDSIEAVADKDHLLVSWQGTSIGTNTSVVVWDPLDIEAQPKSFVLSKTERASNEWQGHFADLPGNEWTAISLARSAGGFFQRVLHMAASRTAEMQPIALLVNRSTGSVSQYHSHVATWPEFVHYLSLQRLHRNDLSSAELSDMVSRLDEADAFSFDNVFAFVSRLQRLAEHDGTGDGDRRWAGSVLRGLLTFLARVARESPSRLLTDETSGNSRLQSLLNVGVPIGRSYPFRWIADAKAVPQSSTYPFEYIRDLWLLGTSKAILEQQFRPVGAVVPDDFAEMQIAAARRVLDFHNAHELPAVSAFVPLAGRTASIESSDRGHGHSFALPPIPTDLRSADDLYALLGFEDKAVDCHATCEDQFFAHRRRVAPAGKGRLRDPRRSSDGQYSLYWCVEEHRWVVETPGASPPTCCYSNSEPLIVEPWRPSDLADKLRDVLNEWSSNIKEPADLESAFGFLAAFRDGLTGDEISGCCHKELFKPPQTESKELFGKVVEVEIAPGLSLVATIAWQLAWIERVTAWRGNSCFFEHDSNPASQREFLRALAKAISLWPDLMHRCIALAELVYWTLYRGGLGISAKYRGKYTDEQLATLRSMPHQPRAVGSNQPASSKPVVDNVSNVAGVILGYNAGIGIVLLHHRSSPSLDATVKEYVRAGESEKRWFASFRWKAIEPEHRERLQRQFSQRHNKGRRGKHFGTLADVMCGLPVRCDLQKKPTWEATNVAINFNAARFNIPKHRRKQPQ